MVGPFMIKCLIFVRMKCVNIWIAVIGIIRHDLICSACIDAKNVKRSSSQYVLVNWLGQLYLR